MSWIGRRLAVSVVTIVARGLLAVPAIAQARTVTIVATALNVRACARLNSTVIGELTYGMKVTLSDGCLDGSSVFGDQKWHFADLGVIAGWFSD